MGLPQTFLFICDKHSYNLCNYGCFHKAKSANTCTDTPVQPAMYAFSGTNATLKPISKIEIGIIISKHKCLKLMSIASIAS